VLYVNYHGIVNKIGFELRFSDIKKLVTKSGTAVLLVVVL